MSMYSFDHYIYNNSEPSWMKRERLGYCEPSGKFALYDHVKGNRLSIVHSVLSMFF